MRRMRGCERSGGTILLAGAGLFLVVVAAMGCAVPRIVRLDEVYTTTIVAASVNRDGEAVDPTREIVEGRRNFFIHSTLTDLRPGKLYTYTLEVRDAEGREVSSRVSRDFIAPGDVYRVWRRISPDWYEHRAGKWEISAGVESQRRLTDLYVISRTKAIKTTRRIPGLGDRVEIHLGLAGSKRTDGDGLPEYQLNQTTLSQSNLYVFALMRDLQKQENYGATIRVFDPFGEIALEKEFIVESDRPRMAHFEPFEFGFLHNEPGVWTIEADIGDNRARATFEVQP